MQVVTIHPIADLPIQFEVIMDVSRINGSGHASGSARQQKEKLPYPEKSHL